ncbi:MAG TPA: endonuclease domain-containing protein [Candidatus Binatus sp.]|uniref:endonuclease domain-containing protein n=1 Tax=Candidatus Binatus sp. TaxID=2811406 RepID=UPI002B4835D2|nr:endonuclease domain-containing protein [Candidatus Binatus sp.]HKN14023.1 endonuclease domain-containing protein [Candidatus Binatus sp.]
MPQAETSHQTAQNYAASRRRLNRSSGGIFEVGDCAKYKFRRQFPIGPYFADFCSIERRLIVEVDGGQHAGQSGDDETRTTYLSSRGYRVLRFWNDQVLGSVDEVLSEIEKFLSSES